MPISLISGGALTGSATNGAAVTLTFPAGVLQNDVVYVCSGIDGTVSPSTTGYTAINAVTSGSHTVGVWRKIMGATPDTSVTINGTGQPQDAHAVVALILRGVEVTQPEDASSTTAFGSSANPDNPAITTAYNTAWVLAFAGSEVNDTAVIAPSGYINQTSVALSDTKPSTTAVATKQISPAGIENPGSWTDWASGTWGAITVAVRPSGFAVISVTGTSGTGQIGTVRVDENEQVTVTSVTGTTAVGTVNAVVFQRAQVTGVSSTGVIGDVAVTGRASIDTVVGVVGNAEEGTVLPSASGTFDVTGVDCSAAVGSVSIRTGLAVLVNGVSCTAEFSDAIFVWIMVNDAQTPDWIQIPV